MKLQTLTAIIALLAIAPTIAHAQTMAVTEKGDTIYVYNNGTWSFEEKEESAATNYDSPLDLDFTYTKIGKEFSTPPEASSEVHSSLDIFSINYDDRVWKRVPPGTINEEAEFAFEHKTKDVWCMVISEQTPIEKEYLFEIGVNHFFESSGAKPEILASEVRIVNGTEVLRGVTKTRMQGMDIVFDTYYYSNDKGSVQFTTWSSANIWEENQQDIINLLNGFVGK